MNEHEASSGMKSHTEEIIAASAHRWQDEEYFASLRNIAGLMGRKKRSIKTIALYYWRLHDGGTERVTSRLATIYKSLGYRVLLLTDEVPSPLDYPVDPAVERFILPSHKGRYVERGSALARLLYNEKVDVFVSNQWFETATAWDLFVAKSLDIPTIIGWHNVFDAGIYGGEDIGNFRRRLAAYQYADLVVSLSLMDQYWFSSQGLSARLIHNPLTFAHMPLHVSRLSSKKIVWVARAEKHQKRIDHVIRMMPLVLQNVPDAKLILVGDGPDRKEAEELARTLGVSSSVTFVGYSSHIEHYLRDAAVHVMTSEFEGSPMVISEAWSFGVPTVMYDLRYLELLREDKGFITVIQLDYQDLAAQVTRVLTNEALRQRLGQEARAAVQGFFNIDIGSEWSQVFGDLEVKDDLSRPLTPQQIVPVAPILASHLAERMYAVDARADRERRELERAQLSNASRSQRRPLARLARLIVASMAKVLEQRPKAELAPLKAIDFGHIGLGDNLMAWSGLHALLTNGYRPAAAGCALYVPNDLSGLATHIFAPFGIRVEGVEPHSRRDMTGPVFSPLPPETAWQWYKTFVGTDWRMNCFEAIDAQKTIPRFERPPDPRDRIRLGLSERILYHRRGWQAAVSDYIGYRLWLPVARKMGILPLIYLAMVKRALPALRSSIGSYIDERATGDLSAPTFALFPAGKSFQAFSPASCKKLMRMLPMEDTAFFIQSSDPWIAEYHEAGLQPRSLNSIEDMLWVIKTSPYLMTTDSFSSHVAQFLRDDFVLALTRDFQEHIVHPGAYPNIVANHPTCAPCSYVPRTDSQQCVAKFNACIAFENSRFVDAIARALKTAAAAKASLEGEDAAAPYDQFAAPIAMVPPAKLAEGSDQL
jgi:glycosyltransferase involved in cell wall biosynthesis